MNDISPPSRVAFCIATDSLHSQKKATVAAQLIAKSEFERLFNTSKPVDAFLTTLPSPGSASYLGSLDSSPWRIQGSPQKTMAALQNCRLWILFTDGEQARNFDGVDLQFARLAVTNYPCVQILFGSCAAGPPSFTKYHLCMRAFPQTSHALLLFHDVDTDQVYVLQAKGCFKNLKGDGVTVEKKNWLYCKWAELRRLRYEELLSVKLPLQFPLSSDKQLRIHDGRVMPNKEYKAMKAETDVGDRFDVERLQEIIKKAAEKETFSPRYTKPSLPTSTITRVDINDQASHIIHMIFMNLDHRSMGIDVPESRIDEYRNELREANTANRLAFEEATAKKQQEDFEKQQSTRKSFLLPVTDPEETFLPGFVRAPLTNRQHSEFRGQCMLCYEEDTILVLLIHDADLENLDHITHIYLPFVFHFMLVCDACAFHIPSRNSYIERAIVAAFPLVSVIDNEVAWTNTFRQVLGPDVHDDEILILIWKWLNTQLVYDVGNLEEGCYRDAMHWVMKDLGKWEDTTRNRRYDTKSICY